MTTIKLKNGSGAPLAGDLVVGEPALDLTNKRLYTEDSGGTVIEVGTNPGEDVTFADNRKAIFGAGSDLQIYHDGSNSIIKDNGTGGLVLEGTTSTQIKGSSFVILRSLDGENMAVGNANGSFDLYYNNVKKLATTATGIDVTGTVTADGLTVDGVANFNANNINYTGSSPRINFYENDATDLNSQLINTLGDFFIRTVSDDAGTTTNRFSLDHATGDISFYDTAGTTAKLFWDASAESLGIGTSSPDSAAKLQIRVASDQNIGFQGTGGNPRISAYNDAVSASLELNINGEQLKFETGGSEAIRLDSSGNLLVGTTNTDPIGANVNGSALLSNGRYKIHSTSGADPVVIGTNTIDTGVGFYYHNGTSANLKGSIDIKSGSVAYNTTSDYRLKENVVPLTGAIERLKQLNPSRFNFIEDADTTVDGFLAHEVADVVPEAITGTKDGMRDEEYEVTPAVYEDVVIPAVLDEEGNEVEAERTEQQLVSEAVMGTRSVPDYQGIDQSKLVPLLVATIQELEARITALESN